MYLFELVFSFFLDMYPGLELLCDVVVLFLVFEVLLFIDFLMTAILTGVR